MYGYLSRKPLMAVKADIFYRFQAKRTMELMNVQFHLARYRLKAYGTASALLMHLIRHVSHSPIAKLGFLRDALMAVRFDSVSKRFGMFFLQDLDIEHAFIGEIMSEDDKDCKNAMGQAKTGKSRPGRAPLKNSEPSEQYPLGKNPSWAQIVSTMEINPKLLMKEWVWDPIWVGNDVAADLFIDFTIGFMSSLVTNIFHSKKMPSKPQSLEEAMEFWTVSSLQQLLSNSKFIASTHHLKRKFPELESPGFCDYFDIFFTPSDHEFTTKSVWGSFVNKGYLKIYHEALTEGSEDAVETLQSELRKYFGRVQCLPDAALGTIGRLWSVADGSIQFLTNPIFYKFEGISSGRQTTRQVFHVKASRNILEARLDEHHRGIPFDQSKGEARKLRKLKKVALARRSTKTKNKRVPPRGRNKKEPKDEDEVGEQKVKRVVIQTRPVAKPPIREESDDDEDEEIDELDDSDEADSRADDEAGWNEEQAEESDW
jgi:hypothetical protein